MARTYQKLRAGWYLPGRRTNEEFLRDARASLIRPTKITEAPGGRCEVRAGALCLHVSYSNKEKWWLLRGVGYKLMYPEAASARRYALNVARRHTIRRLASALAVVPKSDRAPLIDLQRRECLALHAGA